MKAQVGQYNGDIFLTLERPTEGSDMVLWDLFFQQKGRLRAQRFCDDFNSKKVKSLQIDVIPSHKKKSGKEER